MAFFPGQPDQVDPDIFQTSSKTVVCVCVSRTTWVSWYQNGKPFCILMKQKMIILQWHQLDHMQIICISLQITTPVSHPPFLQAGCPSCHPTNSVKTLKHCQVIHIIHNQVTQSIKRLTM